MAKLVISAIIVWHDVTIELNLDRVLHKPAGRLLVDLPQLPDQVCALLDELALRLLKQLLVQDSLEGFKLLDFPSHRCLLAHQCQQFGLEL